jgi:hypothetical protein
LVGSGSARFFYPQTEDFKRVDIESGQAGQIILLFGGFLLFVEDQAE